MPTEFVHVGNINSDTLLALAQDGTEKRGFLAKQCMPFNLFAHCSSWTQLEGQMDCCQQRKAEDFQTSHSRQYLITFADIQDTIPRKMYELRESTVELEKAVSRKYAIHVFITAEKKKHLVLAAAHDEDYAQW